MWPPLRCCCRSWIEVCISFFPRNMPCLIQHRFTLREGGRTSEYSVQLYTIPTHHCSLQSELVSLPRFWTPFNVFAADIFKETNCVYSAPPLPKIYVKSRLVTCVLPYNNKRCTSRLMRIHNFDHQCWAVLGKCYDRHWCPGRKSPSGTGLR